MKTHNRISIIIVFLPIFLCIVPFGDCEEPKEITITHGYMDSLFTSLTKKDAQIATELWFNEVAKFRKEFVTSKAKTVVFHDLPSLIAAVKAKQVDFVGLPSMDFYQVKDKIPLEPFLTYTVGGHPGTVYYLLVSKDKGSTSLNGLKNMRLLVQKHDENGHLPIL